MPSEIFFELFVDCFVMHSQVSSCERDFAEEQSERRTSISCNYFLVKNAKRNVSITVLNVALAMRGYMQNVLNYLLEFKRIKYYFCCKKCEKSVIIPSESAKKKRRWLWF